jgi:hypothetical protein
MIDATGKMTTLDSDGELTIGVVDDKDSFFTYQDKRFALIEENGMYIIRLNELLLICPTSWNA